MTERLTDEDPYDELLALHALVAKTRVGQRGPVGKEAEDFLTKQTTSVSQLGVDN